MSVDLKNSETLKNLMRAFAGESQARNRYTFAASVCRQQKLHVVEAVFRFTADQEKEHAEIFYNHMKELAGQTVAIDGTYPVDLTNDVKELLRKAQHNEYEEHDPVYKTFGDVAQLFPGSVFPEISSAVSECTDQSYKCYFSQSYKCYFSELCGSAGTGKAVCLRCPVRLDVPELRLYL